MEPVNSTLPMIVVLEQVKIPPDSVILEDGNLQSTGPEYCGKDCWRYHIFLIPEDVELLDGTAFAFACGIALSVVADLE